MKLANACRIVSVVTLGVPLLIGTARAGDQYSQSILPAPATGNPEVTALVNTSDFLIKYPGGNKLVVKPSKVQGEGMITQLILTNVSCPAEGNDKAIPYKCGVKVPLAPVPAVVDMSVHQYMTPSIGIDLMHVAGIPIQFIQGKASFVATSKNIVKGPDVFAPATFNLTLGQPLGIGGIAIRTQGSVPADCAAAPPGPGCLDGIEFGFAGMVVGP